MIKIFGHRGCRGSKNPPENSLAAFTAAIAQGANGIELDVFSTSDNQLVVFHDTSLEKLTNGTGKISSKSLAELKTLKLKKNNSSELSEETIPTLNEALDLIKEKAPPEFVVNIEVKAQGLDLLLSDIIRKRLMQNWARDNFLVSSSDMLVLEDFKKKLPAIPIGAIFLGPAPAYNVSGNMLQKKLTAVSSLHLSSVNITYPSMTPHTLAFIQQANLSPVAWTVDEVPPAQLSSDKRAELIAYLKQGHVLITDYPQEMKALVA